VILPRCAIRNSSRSAAGHAGRLLSSILAEWAAECATRLASLRGARPRIRRPRRAWSRLGPWVSGETRLTKRVPQQAKANAAARELSGREVGCILRRPSCGGRPRGSSRARCGRYAIKAARAAVRVARAIVLAVRSGRWQRERLPEAIRDLVLEDQRLRNGICWRVFRC